MEHSGRLRPNILVTGTPGTGKTTLAEQLATRCSLVHVNINKLAEENNLYDEWDEESECHVLNEDGIIDELDDDMREGGRIVDYHACEFFPERWFDVVFVLRTDNSILHGRLKSRNYSPKKIADNIHCEIVQVVLDEARESYSPEIVHEVPSNTTEDFENNIEQIEAWVAHWYQRQAGQ